MIWFDSQRVGNAKEQRRRARHDEDIGTSHDKVHAVIVAIVHVPKVHKIVPEQIQDENHNVKSHHDIFKKHCRQQTQKFGVRENAKSVKKA